MFVERLFEAIKLPSQVSVLLPLQDQRDILSCLQNLRTTERYFSDEHIPFWTDLKCQNSVREGQYIYLHATPKIHVIETLQEKKISSNRVIFVEEVLVSLAGPSEYLPCVCVCCACMHAKVASFVSNSCDSMTVACQAPLSLGFSQKESWGELPYPPSGVFPIQGSNP